MKHQVKMRDLCWISGFCSFAGAFHEKRNAFHSQRFSVKSAAFKSATKDQIFARNCNPMFITLPYLASSILRLGCRGPYRILSISLSTRHVFPNAGIHKLQKYHLPTNAVGHLSRNLIKICSNKISKQTVLLLQNLTRFRALRLRLFSMHSMSPSFSYECKADSCLSTWIFTSIWAVHNTHAII